MNMDQAQALTDVRRRPSYLQRYPGPGAPLRRIVREGQLVVCVVEYEYGF